MSYIKNRKQLLSHGNIKIRKAALDIIDHALANADPYKATCQLVGFENHFLTIGEFRFDLNNYKRIFLLGAGKATYPMARALEDLLGERITDGVIVSK
jgi:glycerate-2-kinase